MNARFSPLSLLLLLLVLFQPAPLFAQQEDTDADDNSAEVDDSDQTEDDSSEDEIDEEGGEEEEVFTFEEIVANPSRFGLYTKAQYDGNFTAGRTAGRKVGRDEVTRNPAPYGLIKTTDIPVVRLSATKGSSISLSLSGGWKRFAQSGMPKGWRFDQKTGVLSGKVPHRGSASIRLTPYKANSQVGAQLTFQLQPSAN